MASQHVGLVASVLLLVLSAPARAGEVLPTCSGGPVPAATLLIPYFEVDLASADRKTTLIAVTNAGDHATLAHVVLWTDWGVPTLAFDLALGPDDVQSLNLRDVFAGVLPMTGGAAFAGCTDPVTLPVLDSTAITALRRRHTGQPDELNHCAGSGRGGVDVATGYVTIDVTRACSPNIHFPSSNGYFAAGAAGIASNENLLLGDFFLVDSAENLAEGGEAVSIVADAQRFGDQPATFYGAWVDRSGVDARAPLGTRYRARFLSGGAFSGGTGLVVWAEPSRALPEATACGERSTAIDVCQFLRYSPVDEQAVALAPMEDRVVTEVVARLVVGGPDLPTNLPFGFFDVENRHVPGCDVPIGPPPQHEVPLQSYVIASHGASGRFAVGRNAARTREDLCPNPARSSIH